MRPAEPVPAALRGAPFSSAEALKYIGRQQLRGSAYRRLATDAYWRADGVVTHGVLMQAHRLTLPEDAVFSGLSAAWALGAEIAWPDDPVEVMMPVGRRLRPRTGLRVRGVRLGGGDVLRSAFGPSTSPVRTVYDLGRSGSLPEAVANVDAVLRACRMGRGSLPAGPVPAARGARRLRSVLELLDPRAESRKESILRVTLVLAGLPPPVPQFVVRAGDFYARLDLAWPELKVAVEYDGGYHDDKAQFAKDRRRLNRLRAAGWQVLVIDAKQLRNPAEVVALMAGVLARV